MYEISFNDKFRKRTKDFAIAIIQYYIKLPKREEHKIIGKQLLRSATSVAANFRASCRARSLKEKYAKLCTVVEESDETLFWLELFEESKLAIVSEEIKKEATEITKVMSSYRKTIKEKL
ncbi:MAG: four helix bundle protein [Saprospiraceae bacterium]|jgi:four helix bundle protein